MNKVLVVGGRPSQLKDLLENPNVIWWDSREIQKAKRRIPPDVRSVLALYRFLGHADCSNLKRLTKNHGISFKLIKGTGELKRLLEEQ